MHLLSEGQIKCFCFHLETHSVSLTRLHQHYCGYWNHAAFPRVNIWAALRRGAWQSLNFDKEYLFGFETLVFATSGILSMHKQLVTLQRERKLEITSSFKKSILFIKQSWTKQSQMYVSTKILSSTIVHY